MTAARLLLVTALVLGVTAPATSAGPSLSVHARTELRLRPIRKDYGGVYVIAGQLVDRFSGAGIGYERVRLSFAGRDHVADTDSDGRFEIRVDAPGGRQDLRVEYRGSDLLDPAEVVLDDIDIDKMGVDLTLTTSAETGGVRITVTAAAAGAAIDLPVKLMVGPADAAPEVLKLASTVTSGDAPYVLTRIAAGGPGRWRVRAVFDGDGLYNPTTADATVELGTSTTVTLNVSDRTLAYEDDLTASGNVVDEDGQGVRGAAVALTADDRRVGQVMTGADGGFKFRIEGATLGQGRRALQAAVEPTEGWMRRDDSDIVHVEVDAPQPVPIAYTIAAFAITALVAAGFFAARTRPWQRLARRAPDDRERQPGEVAAEPAPGLSLARPSLVSTLRRPADHGFAGAVRDAIRHRALPGAVLTLRRGDQTTEVEAGADGAFAVEELTAGDWQIEVVLRGHVTERFPITVPHRGELRGARIDLMPVRERIFSLYKRCAVPLLPDPALWGVWSPRQVFDHVRKSSRPATALSQLTDFVEESYFSAMLPDQDRLPDAERQVEAALREQVRSRV